MRLQFACDYCARPYTTADAAGKCERTHRTLLPLLLNSGNDTQTVFKWATLLVNERPRKKLKSTLRLLYKIAARGSGSVYGREFRKVDR